jgi:hypothetical protein
MTPTRASAKRTAIVIHHTHAQEHTMKHGHVTGTKREKKGSQDWYRAIAQEHIDRITKEWEAKQQQASK